MVVGGRIKICGKNQYFFSFASRNSKGVVMLTYLLHVKYVQSRASSVTRFVLSVREAGKSENLEGQAVIN